MPQELYSAAIAGVLDGTERLWLGDSGSPYYLTLNRMVYKDANGRYFCAGPLQIDSGTGGSLEIGAFASPFSINFTDASGEAVINSPDSIQMKADELTFVDNSGTITYLSLRSTGNTSTFAPASGLRIYDADRSHTLRFSVGSDLTANRTLTLTTGNADRTLDISAGSVTITAAGNALTSAADAAAQVVVLGTDARYGRVVASSGAQSLHSGNTSPTTLATISLPGGSLGPNGWVEIEVLWSHTDNGNSKTLKVKFGGTEYFALTVSTGATDRTIHRIANRNSASSQVGGPSNRRGYENSASAVTTSAVNTASDVTILLEGTLANGADSVAVESYCVKSFYKA